MKKLWPYIIGLIVLVASGLIWNAVRSTSNPASQKPLTTVIVYARLLGVEVTSEENMVKALFQVITVEDIRGSQLEPTPDKLESIQDSTPEQDSTLELVLLNVFFEDIELVGETVGSNYTLKCRADSSGDIIEKACFFYDGE